MAGGVERVRLPLLYERAGRALSESVKAPAFEVGPGQLATALDGLRALGFRGASLGPSLQAEALVLCEQASEPARALGRATEITFEPSGLCADHFVAEAMTDRLRANATAGNPPGRGLVFGTGPDAGAALWALHRSGCVELTLVGERTESMERLLLRMKPHLGSVSLRMAERSSDEVARLLAESERVVHAPDESPLPLPEAWPARAGTLLDLGLAEVECESLNAARLAGWKIEGSSAVLAQRGLLAMARWRNSPVPDAVAARMRALLRCAGGAAGRVAA
jgi:shikimate dehydrogenase